MRGKKGEKKEKRKNKREKEEERRKGRKKENEMKKENFLGAVTHTDKCWQ